MDENRRWNNKGIGEKRKHAFFSEMRASQFSTHFILISSLVCLLTWLFGINFKDVKSDIKSFKLFLVVFKINYNYNYNYIYLFIY